MTQIKTPPMNPGGFNATIQSVDARGNLKTLDYGNGLRASYRYDAQSRLEEITTPGVQGLSYDYDPRGNLKSRTDTSVGTEHFAYDGLNRLKSISLNSAAAHAGYRYSEGGKLLCAGSYAACGPGTSTTSHSYSPSRPNALVAFTSQIQEGTSTYGYDAKGNQTSRSGGMGSLTVEYAVFNKPTRMIHADMSETRYAYGPNRQRYLREDINGGSMTRTYYVGNVEVRSQHLNGQEQYRQYRRDLGTAIQTVEQNGTTSTQYVHRDHLGSIDVLTNDLGQISEKFSYDAFGRRRKPDDWSIDSPKLFNGVSGATANATLRGFTNHEHIAAGPNPAIGLIHMNGRTYDPQTGRFMQADPFIPNPGLGQSYNRYSYVRNNPLTLTDPSGFNEEEEITCDLNDDGCFNSERPRPSNGFRQSRSRRGMGLYRAGPVGGVFLPGVGRRFLVIQLILVMLLVSPMEIWMWEGRGCRLV